MILIENNTGGLTVGRIEFAPIQLSACHSFENTGYVITDAVYVNAELINQMMIESLRKLEKFIWEKQDSFMKEFAYHHNRSCNDLTSVSFSSENCHFAWVSFEGQHFSDSIKMLELQEWIEKETKNVR